MVMSNVYFGTDANEVSNASGGPPHMETTFDPGLLNIDTTYYWRVDTFNGAEWVKGNLWSFSTRPEIPPSTDPNLILLYNFNESAGTNAIDWSGHDNDGKILGNPQWITGYDGSALNLGSGNYVAIQNLHYDNASGIPEVTVCAWIRTNNGADQIIVSYDRSDYWRLQINGEVATDGQIGWHVWTDEGQNDYGSLTRVDDGLWHHVCGVFDNGLSTIYIDGEPEPSSRMGSTFGRGREVRYGYVGLGSESTEFNADPRTPADYFDGDLDEIRIYNKALTQDEIIQVMRVNPLLAWDLKPPSRTYDIESVPSTLTWKAGDNASQHDVYFGTDEGTVSNADASDTTGVYRGRQAGTTYVPTEVFAWDTTYFWRIDEFNADGSITKGSVRAIIVADYITIDDIESYNDIIEGEEGSNRIYNAWIDGVTNPANGGSEVGYFDVPLTEQTIVHGGRQSMPLAYDNATGKSEATLTLTGLRNWTKHDLAELSLWFHGDPCNVAEPIYFALNDNAVVTNENPNAVLVEEWTEWTIDLQTFADQGVNLTNVNTIAIGLGNRNNPQPGGSGLIYIDDIRLYQPRPVDPGTDGLVAYYEMENDVNDSSGNSLHGTTVGDPIFVEGLPDYGMALDFDGTDDLVELGKFDVVGQITLAAWIRPDDFEINDARIVTKAKEWGGDDHWWMLSTISETSLRFRLKTDEGASTATLISDPVLEAGVFTHVAATWDGSMMRIYKDGVEVASQEKGGTAVAVNPDVSAAIGSQPSDAFASDPGHVVKFFDGLIDDVRIYDRALSDLELRYLAGDR